MQVRALLRGALKDADLTPQRNILQLQRSAGLQHGKGSAEEDCEPSGDQIDDFADEV
ncbi:MAG: hypothetical protein H7Y20_18695 [Bryobacteraceae bacterium]|nr:hypothetical protein [Bryobacteraceae bacterium]